MTKINLLPEEYRSDTKVSKTGKLLFNLDIVLGVIFVVSMSLLAASLLFLSLTLANNQKSLDGLKANVVAQENFEKRLFYVRDRISNAQKIVSSRKIEPKIKTVSDITQSLPTGVALTEIDVTQNLLKVSVIVANSVALTEFLGRFSLNPEFSKVILKTFSFNPTNGYFVVLEIS